MKGLKKSAVDNDNTEERREWLRNFRSNAIPAKEQTAAAAAYGKRCRERLLFKTD